ncbi:pre-peptidase C-terminal domain-containing protein [Capilliphycus salinus ALCB114379]|uniref:pre-peptidase C-terminal domain-containing protein n=1 Tax=Capilliphycus salinus TaxID=2768948 RepID=UPI0039A53498
MSGQRYANAINNPSASVQINVAPSEIKPNVPITFTAYPIGAAPGLTPNLNIQFTPEANVLGFPSNTNIDFAGNGNPETLGFPNGFPVGEGAVVRVSSFANTGPFLFEVSAETFNNTAVSAEPQGIINTSRSLNGFVGRSDDQDWYQFVAPPTGGTFTFNLSNLVDNADLRIVRDYGGGSLAVLSQGLNGGTANEQLQVPLEANQPYFVQVSNAPNGSNLSDAGATSTRYNLEIIPGTMEQPSVSVSALGNPSEMGPTPGTFQIWRTGDTTTPLTVNFTVGGTATFGIDYNQIGSTFSGGNGTVIIPAGQNSANITINPVNDGIADLNETIEIGLQAAAGYGVSPQNSATLTILDSSSSGGSGERVARYWDNTAGSHFFTADLTEQQIRNADPRYNNEGFEFRSEGNVTLQRYVNTKGGYFYASNPGEIAFVQTLQEWRADPAAVPIEVYSSQQPGTLPVYRAFNLDTNGHFYTVDFNQALYADSLPDFRLEGISFFAKPGV